MSRAVFLKAREGSTTAFEALVHQYQRMVESLAYSKCLDADMALDIAQEVFLKAWRLLDTVKDEEALGGWLAALTRTTTIDALRKHREQPVAETPELRHIAPPEARLEELDRKQALEKALRRLPEDFREIILLRYFQDLSYKEIAEILGTTLSVVEIRLFRARRRLKDLLEGE